jgi:hypothetical protein
MTILSTGCQKPAAIVPAQTIDFTGSYLCQAPWLKALVFHQSRYRKFSGVCAWKAFLIYGSCDVRQQSLPIHMPFHLRLFRPPLALSMRDGVGILQAEVRCWLDRKSCWHTGFEFFDHTA